MGVTAWSKNYGCFPGMKATNIKKKHVRLLKKSFHTTDIALKQISRSRQKSRGNFYSASGLYSPPRLLARRASRRPRSPLKQKRTPLDAQILGKKGNYFQLFKYINISETK